MLLAIFTTLAEQPTPRIELSEYTWHFGTHPQHTTLYRDLIMYNNGTADLELQDLLPICGYTVLDRGQYPLIIPPGGSHTANVSFNTLNYQGDILKNIVVSSNDTTNSTITVYFWCTVEQPQITETARTFTIPTTTNTTPTDNQTTPTTTVNSPATAILAAIISAGVAVRIKR